MAIQNATLTFSLPEDADANRIDIYSSSSENGTYTIATSTDYEYGTTFIEYTTLDDTKWYKLLFVNTTTGYSGAPSDAVFGGTYSAAAPFVAVSTTWDGANYATTQDVYDYADLTSEDVTTNKVSRALKRARAEIDYRTSELGIDRFENLDTKTARRKYNASLVILKEAEICLALHQIYTNLSDNLIIRNMRDGTGSIAGSISIGGTSISGDSLAERDTNIAYIATLAERYYMMAYRKLASLDQNTIRLVPGDLMARLPRFRYPFFGWN